MKTYSGEHFSFPKNLASCCSEQMDVPESVDVIMNVMPPIVFWNLFHIGGIFQHDSARPHTSKLCQDVLQQNSVHVLPMPG